MVLPVNLKSLLQDPGPLLLPPLIASKSQLIVVKLRPNGHQLPAGLQEMMSLLSKNLVREDSEPVVIKTTTKKTNRTEENNLRGVLSRMKKDPHGANLRSQRKMTTQRRSLLFPAVIRTRIHADLSRRMMKIESLVQNLNRQVRRISWRVSENCSFSTSALLSSTRTTTASTPLSSTEMVTK